MENELLLGGGRYQRTIAVFYDELKRKKGKISSPGG